MGGPFDRLAAHNMAMVGVAEGSVTRQGFADIVSRGYFETMGVHVIRGRSFTDEEERPGSRLRTVIVSHQFWKRAGFAEDILSRTVRINGSDYAIVGVAPEGFGGTSALIGSEFFLPLGVHDDLENEFNSRRHRRLADRQTYTLIIIGRLKPGLTRDQADQQLKAIAAANEQAFPVENKNQDLIVRPLTRLGVSTSPRSDAEVWAPLGLLQALSGAVLLIACLNLANMMLAAGAVRQKEIAIRLAVGSSRVQIVRQLLVHGLLLSLMGGIAGLIVASWSMQALIGSMTTVLPIAVILDMTPDTTAIAATFVFCTLATVGFGLWPALRLARTDVAPALKDQAGEIDGLIGRRVTVRGALVTAQLALSLALLILSGLFVRGAAAGASANPGFALEPLVLAEVDPRLGGYDDARGHELRRAALERLRATPGVGSAAVASIIPFGNISIGVNVQREGPRLRPEDPEVRGKQVWAFQYVIGSDYFRTLGVPMLRGREFTAAEEAAPTGTQPVIIDAPLAAKLFPNEDPIGRVLQFGLNDDADAQPMEIVGLAPGLRHDLTDIEPTPHVYLPTGRTRSATLFLYARAASGRANSMITTVRDQLRAVDANAPIISIKSFATQHESSASVWFLRAAARLFLTLGLAAALVAVVGLYGVKSYVMSRRTREFGVRMAIGASPAEIIKLVMREAAATTVIGLIAGLAIGAALGVGANRLIYLVRPFDLPSLAGATAILVAAMLLATVVPARRASRVAPMAALRDS